MQTHRQLTQRPDKREGSSVKKKTKTKNGTNEKQNSSGGATSNNPRAVSAKFLPRSSQTGALLTVSFRAVKANLNDVLGPFLMWRSVTEREREAAQSTFSAVGVGRHGLVRPSAVGPERQAVKTSSPAPMEGWSATRRSLRAADRSRESGWWTAGPCAAAPSAAGLCAPLSPLSLLDSRGADS